MYKGTQNQENRSRKLTLKEKGEKHVVIYFQAMHIYFNHSQEKTSILDILKSSHIYVCVCVYMIKLSNSAIGIYYYYPADLLFYAIGDIQHFNSQLQHFQLALMSSMEFLMKKICWKDPPTQFKTHTQHILSKLK